MSYSKSFLWKGVLAQLILLLALAGAAQAAPLAANNGTIQSLTASGADDPGDPIQINALAHAQSSIERSNLYYELYDPAGNLLTTWKVDTHRLSAGDDVSDSWSYANPPDTGDYTVTLCWSTGNAENCDIDYAETTFYSVPTLGLPLTLGALGLLVAFVLQKRDLLAGGGG